MTLPVVPVPGDSSTRYHQVTAGPSTLVTRGGVDRARRQLPATPSSTHPQPRPVPAPGPPAVRAAPVSAAARGAPPAAGSWSVSTADQYRPAGRGGRSRRRCAQAADGGQDGARGGSTGDAVRPRVGGGDAAGQLGIDPGREPGSVP